MPPLITFLSDFGLTDDFVGTCHGVIAGIAPDVRVIDITHGIRPGHVVQGALVLANTLPYMPAGIHLAVVDPGVGGGRRALALRDGEGRLHVGPDNGLLLLAADRFGGVAAAHELANADYSLQPVSRTFHGRDLFAPAAAHLASGVDPAELGPLLDPEELVRLELPEAAVGHNRIRAAALVLDRFGNIALNLRREQLDAIDLGPGTRVELTCRGERFYAVFARTFADAPRGELILYEDSYGSLALAVSSGSAAQLLRAEEGTEIVLELGAP
ncbi:MAG TPA: SAM-dependent chlorinase/fluorinase [Gaiellaceae bacterium]|nr:SAM-dependent chlorinase/fluorinase [Gaiellaceae bacterium]